MTRCKYLELMTEQIRCKSVRHVIAEELETHMDEQKMDFMAEGMTEQEAEEAAVREMGDPVEVGVEMDRIHRPKTPWKLFAWIVGLSLAGFVFSTLLLQDAIAEGSYNSDMIVKNGWLLFWAIVVMAGVCLIDYSRIAQHAELVMALYMAGLILGGIFAGWDINGRSGWIRLPIIGTMNISMLLYLSVPLYGAILFHHRGEGYGGLMKSVLWMLPPIVIAYTRPDVVTAAILLATFAIMLSVALCRRWFKVAWKKALALLWAVVILLPAGVGAYWLYAGNTYQAMRLQSMLGMREMSYITTIVKGMTAKCVLVGEGAGKRMLNDLPGIGDYVLTGIMVSYGILAAVVLVAAILLLFFSFFRKSLRQKNQLGMMMGTGCTVLLSIQFLIYLAVNILGFPISAYCPFLTLGGTGRLVIFAIFGLLLSIFRYENVAPEPTCMKKRSRFRIKIVRE